MPSPADHPDSEPTGVVRWLGVGVLVLALVGTLARVVPLVDSARLFHQFPTEDGYLSLTIARNIALGKGMAVADGSVATNGTQPLVTFLWAAVFWLVDGSREAGVRTILALEVGFSALTAFLIARLGVTLFGHDRLRAAVSRLAGALWFASPVALPHTMNCLETGPYAAAVTGSILAFVKLGRRPGPWGWLTVAAFGFGLGITFLARNDAVLLCASIAVTHVLSKDGASYGRRFAEAAVMGLVALIPAAPWFAYNLSFGHLVPISGRAESEAVALGENLRGLPAVLAETVSLFVLIPHQVEGRLPIVLGSTVVVAAFVSVVVVALRRSHSSMMLRAGASVLGFATLLALYYGLFFGAGWFLSRYMFPLTPFVAIAWGAGLLALTRLRAPLRRGLGAAFLAVVFVSSSGHGYRLHARGTKHQHDQVVNWARENVANEQWIAAIQSGTLGFFHDRVLNLDGKVSPEALAARQADRIPAYVEAKRADFLVDWAGIASWAKLPGLSSYELLVNDPVANLGVLRRRGSLTVPEARRASGQAAR